MHSLDKCTIRSSRPVTQNINMLGAFEAADYELYIGKLNVVINDEQFALGHCLTY